MVPIKRVKALLNYDPKTGKLLWRVSRGCVKAGTTAGWSRPDGYRRVKIDGEEYTSHALVWVILHGRWPKKQLDHKDCSRSNNTPHNLRAASPRQNQRNSRRRQDNTSGFKGVGWHKGHQKWRARIRIKNKRISLGYFATPRAAHAAYVRAAKGHFGRFARLA